MYDFGIEVDLHWHVTDPRQVVRDGVRDVRAALQPLLLARIRPITRMFRPEGSADAESKVNEVLTTISEAGELGLTASAIARLRMEDAVRDEFRLDRKVLAYRKIIAAGDVNQFAFTLAMNPESAPTVVKALIDERDRARKETIDFVTNLVKSGAIERWQVADQIRVALQWLLDSSNRVITGTDETRPPSFGPDLADG
jgi:cysteinyl-tRNA synthetase